jgi:predicted nucleotidyltransferase
LTVTSGRRHTPFTHTVGISPGIECSQARAKEICPQPPQEHDVHEANTDAGAERPRSPEQVLAAAARDIAEQTGLRMVVLFGSAARGEARQEDLDLGVLGGDREAIDSVDLTNRFTVALGRQDVDVVDLGRADPVLLMLVARDGVPLYEKAPSEFACFYSLAARRFADTRKFRDAERDWIRGAAARRDGR